MCLLKENIRNPAALAFYSALFSMRFLSSWDQEGCCTSKNRVSIPGRKVKVKGKAFSKGSAISFEGVGPPYLHLFGQKEPHGRPELQQRLRREVFTVRPTDTRDKWGFSCWREVDIVSADSSVCMPTQEGNPQMPLLCQHQPLKIN